MSDQPHVNVRRRRRGSPPQPSRMRIWAGILLALLLVGAPLSAPANAAVDPEPPRGEAPTSDAGTDIVITSLGEGRRNISGALPPLGDTWPIDAYPTTRPAGYEPETVGFAGVINTQEVGGTTTAQMYCIDLRTSTRVGIGYENGTWDESNVPNIGYVNRILNTYYPSTNLPTGVNNNDKAAAVQAAIWFFTDGYVVDRGGNNLYSTVASIVNATIAAGPLEEPDAPDISITPATAEAAVTGVAGPYTVTSEADQITVTVDDGFGLFADAAGTVPLTNPVASGTQVWVRSEDGGTGPAAISARAVVTVPTGSVYLYDGATSGVDTAQKLILADTRELSSAASATATFFEVGALTVTKSIEGPAAGSQDAVVISIDCGPGYQFTFNIDAGTTGTPSETFTDIPAGTACTITEPTNGTNESVQVSTTIVPTAVTIPSGSTATATVTDTYTFTPGTLVVTKTNTGEADGAQGEVIISVVCTLDGATVLDTTVTIPAGTLTPEAAEFPNLAAGTSCTVTETATGETTSVSVEVAGEGTVTIPAAGSVTAALTNTYTFTPGTLAVRKDIAGTGAGRQGTVTLQVTCSSGLNQTITIPAGTIETTTEEFPGLPAGTTCTVTETADGATTEVSVTTVVDPAGGAVTVPAGDGVEVTFTDTYTVNPGALVVNKAIAGVAAGQQGDVTLQVTCTLESAVVAEETFTVTAGTTGTVPAGTLTGIPEGASCAVTEPVTGETTEIGVVVDLPDSVTITAGATATATVTDTYSENPGILIVTKVITGEAAGNQDAVEIDVLCTLGGETVFEETSQIPAGETGEVGAQFLNIPSGASCAITEPVTGATEVVQVSSEIPTPVTITPGGTESATVTNTYTFAPGTLTVTKSITGEAASEQGEVVLQVQCGPDGSVLDETVTIPAGSTGDVPTTFEDLPAGTECTVTEPTSGATETVLVSTELPDPVTIPAAGGSEATVTNTYTFAPGTLTVTKSITGEAAGEQGEVVLQVLCGPDGSVLSETVTIPAGSTGDVPTTFEDLPAGTECTVTEPTSGATETVLVSTELPDPVTIPAGDGAEATVTNTYTFAPGTLTVTKSITGEAAGEQGEVILQVLCGPDGSVLDTTVTIPAGSTGDVPTTFEDLPAGTECTVTEPTSGATETVLVSTELPDPVTIPAADGAEATVTNTYTFAPGTLTVTKSITGEAAGEQGEVVLQVLCGPDGSVLSETVTIPAGSTGDVPTTFEDLPAGTECTVTEPTSGATETVLVSTELPDPVTIPAADGAEATVTNTYTFAPGTLTVTKSIAGEAAGEQGEVVLQVLCGPDGSVLSETVTIPEGSTGDVPTTFEDLPAGTECTVTEPTSGASETVLVSTELPDPVTIPAGDGTEATVTNTYTFAPGTLTVSKTITGEAAGQQGEIVLQVRCGPDGSVLDTTVTIPAGSTDPDSTTFEDLPTGTECTVTEPTSGATETVLVSTELPDPVTIPAGGGSEAAVTNTYTFAPGTLTVTKSIAGDAAGQQGEVVLQVLCGPDGSVLSETVTIPAGTTGDVPATFEDLPAGTECTVTEPTSGASETVLVSTVLPEPVTVVGAQTVAATVTNTYTLAPGTLTVTKVITGDASGAQGEVVLRVMCGPDGTVLDETVTIPAGTTGAVSTGFQDLPTGTECTVTEPVSGATSTVNVAADLPDPVMIPAGGGAEATVTNTYSSVVAPTPKPTPAPVKPARPDLPSTGANGTVGFLAAGAGLLLAGGIAMAASRRRANSAEDDSSHQQ
ncbi:thioester domain-containing protein [Arthrobacter sp. ZGTC212]|uniref:beta strand repeat-containing protein n=1 Tax=Arthrobacter sp. ZGTC212 TaxID=2058899 RepID=UPI000CE52E3D|nr:thioester domain-containing protein [Arthrobacter sp. ZGTC212]